MRRLSIIQRNKSLGYKVWYLRIPTANGVKFRSLKTAKKWEAERILEAEKRKLQNFGGEYDLPPILELLETWMKGNEGTLTKGTFKYYNDITNLFRSFCQSRNIRNFVDITGAVANDFILTSKKEKRKRTYKIVCRSWSNWVINMYGLNKRNPFLAVKVPQVGQRLEFWTWDEIKRIIDTENSNLYKLLYSFMAYAGLRIGEALKLTWDDVEGGKIVILQDKTRKNSVLPMAQIIKDKLKEFSPKKGEKIFSMTDTAVRYKLIKTCKFAGIEGQNIPHKFRHSFASNLLRSGANIIAVSKLMRHAKPSMTLNVYSHVLPEDLDETLNRYMVL